MAHRQGTHVVARTVTGEGVLSQSWIRQPAPPRADGPGTGPDTWTMRFTSSVKAVALARHQVEKTLTAWRTSTQDIERIVLVTSELATNAVRHGHVPERLFEVRLSAEPGGGLLLEVSDASSQVPEPVHAGEEDESGRGLALVAALADGFGHRKRRYAGKTVWARFRTGSAD